LRDDIELPRVRICKTMGRAMARFKSEKTFVVRQRSASKIFSSCQGRRFSIPQRARGASRMNRSARPAGKRKPDRPRPAGLRPVRGTRQPRQTAALLLSDLHGSLAGHDQTCESIPDRESGMSPVRQSSHLCLEYRRNRRLCRASFAAWPGPLSINGRFAGARTARALAPALMRGANCIEAGSRPARGALLRMRQHDESFI
jgi:hypothetical protein